jgi:hypothetical protein
MRQPYFVNKAGFKSAVSVSRQYLPGYVDICGIYYIFLERSSRGVK